MNNRFLRFGKKTPMDRKKKNILLSIAILFELILLCTVMSYAWVETISSIKLNNLDPDGNDLVPNTKVNESYVHTRVHLTEAQNTVDLGKYFRQAGDMHLSPASSVNGESFWFPEINPANNSIAYHSNLYRSGTIDDKNTTYMSVTFKLTTEAASDIYFNADPTFSVYSDKIRVSVKAVSDDPSNHDHSSETVTQTPAIFYQGAANTSADNTFSVVGAANGTSSNQSAHTFYKYAATNNSKTKLFRVNAGETMTVTVNLWLQHVSGDMDAVMSQALTITNFGLTSSQVPRSITLIPSSKWADGGTYYYYAWCWSTQNDPNSVLYPISLDPLTGHYTFRYNSSFLNTLFIRSDKANLTKDSVWNTGTRIQTIDTSIPDTPENPTAVITSKNSNDGKADVSWIEPVEISVKPINGQSAAASQLSVTTYLDTTINTTSVMEQSTNTADSPHFRKAHGWNGKEFKLGATAASGWQFVGWYSDAAGTNLVSSTNAYSTNISTAAGGTKTYYARFKEVRKIQLYKYLDGTNTSSTSNSIKINSGTAVTSASTNATVDKGSTVTLSATAASGYTLTGFYTTSAGGDSNKIKPETTSGSTKSVTITANSSNVTANYYALFTTNYYNVTAHACYSTDNGSSYTEDNSSTGGTVKVTSTGTAGASDSASIKYNTPVSVYASAASGYEFDGWYSAANGGTRKSTSTTYTFTVGAADVDVYARFTYRKYNVIAKAYSTTNGTTYANNVTGGTVKAGTAAAGSSSSALVMRGNNVTLTATAKPGYLFEGWYTAATGGTSVNTKASFSYTLSATATADVTVFARFKKMDDIYLKGSFASDGWDNGYQMIGNSSGVYTYTYNNLSEGGSFEFKIYNATQNKWYGYGSSVQEFETCTNRQLGEGNSYKNLKLHGHAGDYTFSYNSTNNKLTVTVSYDYITITLWDDTTAGNGHWIGNDSAQVYFGSDEGWYGPMTKDGYQYTISVPSNCSTNAKFERRVNGDTKNTFSNGNRGYKQGFSARDNGSSSYWY